MCVCSTIIGANYIQGRARARDHQQILCSSIARTPFTRQFAALRDGDIGLPGCALSNRASWSSCSVAVVRCAAKICARTLSSTHEFACARHAQTRVSDSTNVGRPTAIAHAAATAATAAAATTTATATAGSNFRVDVVVLRAACVCVCAGKNTAARLQVSAKEHSRAHKNFIFSLKTRALARLASPNALIIIMSTQRRAFVAVSRVPIKPALLLLLLLFTCTSSARCNGGKSNPPVAGTHTRTHNNIIRRSSPVRAPR